MKIIKKKNGGKDYEEEGLAKGMTEPYGHAVSRPPVVAVEATERAILLAKLAKASLYVAHVTAKGAMEGNQRCLCRRLSYFRRNVYTLLNTYNR